MPVEQQKYSVIKQMILSIIPFVDLWAFYRIEKLRLWVGVYIVLIAFWTIWFSYLETPETSKIWIWGSVIELIITPLVMRHFTLKWNEIQFK